MSPVYICNIRNYSTVKEKLKVNYLITYKNLSLPNVVWLPDLGPSKELFIKSRDMDLSRDEDWEEYQKDFKKVTETDSFQCALGNILGTTFAGISPVLMCYCEGERCHRYLVGDILEKKGVRVIYV